MTDITTGSFDTRVFPPEIVTPIINAGLAGAPVFNTFTRRLTDSGTVVFPTGDPSGFDFVPELGTIPTVDPGDDALVVAPAKIAGTLLLSNESIADSRFNIADEVGRLIADSMAVTADTQMLYGPPSPNPAAPAGLIDSLTAASGDNLRTAVVNAAAAILGAGGTPNVLLLPPALWADEMARREDSPVAVGPLFADLGLNLDVRVAHTLEDTDALLIDTSGCFGVVRSDYTIEGSDTTADAWTKDGWSMRVKARIAMAVPTPDKHARVVNIASA